MADVWINGRFEPEETAQVSLRDAGLLHAAGVFTTMRCYAGRVFCLPQHLRRLRNSCDTLLIPLACQDEQVVHAIGELLHRNKLSDARLRLTVTRGTTGPHPLHDPSPDSTVFLTATALRPYPAEAYAHGLAVMVVEQQKLNPYDIQAGHKTLNYFSRLASLRQANRDGAGEALWFNVHNYLESGCISNVFVVQDDVLITPPTTQDLHEAGVHGATPYPRSTVLPGITRAAVLELAQQAGMEIQLAAIDREQLWEAEELFLTNSIMQIMPVCRIQDHVVGSNRPGPITRNLMERYNRLVDAQGVT